MLDGVAPKLLQGPDCIRLDTTYSDGRAAAAAVAKTRAHVWIPDDSSWSAAAGGVDLAKDTAGAGTVLATSPLYMVSDAATGARLRSAGGTWMALAKLVDARTLRLVVRDPAGSGDGLLGTGAVAEAVWQAEDMDASALWLSRAIASTRTVAASSEVLRTKAGEVGLVPEYALAEASASTIALNTMDARPTGTGLHDTILAAYTSARDRYRPGVPNQMMVFTDGRNQDDPGGASAGQLATRLQALQDPKRPVQLSVVAFGDRQAAEVVGKAIEPIGGYVDFLTTPNQVAAVFIHVAAGGLHH